MCFTRSRPGLVRGPCAPRIMMRIKIKVIPGSSQEKIVEKDGILRVYVRAAPEKGKANKVLMGLIAKKYGIRKSGVKIISGLSGRNKVVEVEEK